MGSGRQPIIYKESMEINTKIFLLFLFELFMILRFSLNYKFDEMTIDGQTLDKLLPVVDSQHVTELNVD